MGYFTAGRHLIAESDSLKRRLGMAFLISTIPIDETGGRSVSIVVHNCTNCIIN